MTSKGFENADSSDIPASGVAEAVLRDLGRGFGGGLIFALPMLMTMEMWWLGFYIDRFRLALLLALGLPLLTVLSRHSGFEKTVAWREDFRDALIAYGIGVLSSALALTIFGLLQSGMPMDEVVGKVAIQALPAGIGALLARSQFGGQQAKPDPSSEGKSYFSELFLMCIGALFLGLNVAPTEEMVLISYKMTEWHALALILASLVLMHGFVYAVGFKGGAPSSPDEPWWSTFLRFTVVGYALAAAVSIYMLWTFGRTDGASVTQSLMSVVVLGFPAAIGAAAARLIL